MTQPLPCPLPARPGQRSLGERLADTLLELLSSHPPNDALLVACVPAPPVDSLATWFSRVSDSWFWAPSDGTVWCGSGAAAEVTGHGPSRFEQVQTGAESLWNRLRTLPSHPVHLAPRLVGGFSFRPDSERDSERGSERDSAWSSFGDARFVLPRWTLVRDAESTWMMLAVTVVEARGDALRELARIDLFPRQDDRARWQTIAQTSSPEDAWFRLVVQARRDIEAGSLRKVVAARSTTVRTDKAIDPRLVLRQLQRDNPSSTTFGVRVGGATFAGATPETLIQRRGLSIRTEALAGTCPRDASDPEKLLDSKKDRHEQRIVEEDIVGQLAPLCASMHVPQHPVPHALRSLVHLHTPIEGVLHTDTHVLQLVKRLHPTPAVGGLPREAARRWLDTHEPLDRGWYASPVGWFDAEGNGSFVVALRCGLFEGDRAVLYAGAGLVRGSDPAAEFSETGWKLQIVREAIDAAGGQP